MLLLSWWNLFVVVLAGAAGYIGALLLLRFLDAEDIAVLARARGKIRQRFAGDPTDPIHE